MDYTTSADNVVHGPTGQRMHSDSVAVPTVWSGDDGNMLIWSLMELLKLANIDGQPFNPDDPASYTRLRDALLSVFAKQSDLFWHYPRVYALSEIPKVDYGPIVVYEVCEIWRWTISPYFTGYRSPLCGRPVDGHTVTPLYSEVDAVGGTLSKTAYAGLWGYAQENGLIVASGSWAPGMHRFVDLGGDNFRCPDLRNQFRRYTGTDADTANARTLGSGQRDAMQAIAGNIGVIMVSGAQTGPFSASDLGASISFAGAADGNRQKLVDYSNGRVARTSTETRASNTAYAPRIHI